VEANFHLNKTLLWLQVRLLVTLEKKHIPLQDSRNGKFFGSSDDLKIKDQISKYMKTTGSTLGRDEAVRNSKTNLK
jgi:hypothetical protein